MVSHSARTGVFLTVAPLTTGADRRHHDVERVNAVDSTGNRRSRRAIVERWGGVISPEAIVGVAMRTTREGVQSHAGRAHLPR